MKGDGSGVLPRIMGSDRHEINICSGPLLSQLLRFAVPLIFSGWLQLLFVSADMVVVGRYGSSDALAAVGAASYVANLLINFFCGISIGVNVQVSRFFGAGDRKNVSRTVHTAIAASLAGGVLMMLLGFVICDPLLRIMNVPEELMGRATNYVMIYLFGLPFIMLYNFCGAIMRAVGDTRRPMIFIIIAGGVNVVLNLIFVILFRMQETGVALATVISMMVGSGLCLRVLGNSRSSIRFSRKNLRIDRKIFREMLWIGVPAGLQGLVFGVSNMTVQSAINTFGPAVIAGNTAALNFEWFIYNISYGFHQTIISVVGQTTGGKRYDRLCRSISYSLIISAAITGVFAVSLSLFGSFFIGIYNSDPGVIKAGAMRMALILPVYVICAVMDVLSGALRGLGHSMLSAVSTIGGVCGLRVLWVMVIFPCWHSMTSLLLCYPVSWALTSLTLFFFLKHHLLRIIKSAPADAVLPKAFFGRGIKR